MPLKQGCTPAMRVPMPDATQEPLEAIDVAWASADHDA